MRNQVIAAAGVAWTVYCPAHGMGLDMVKLSVARVIAAPQEGRGEAASGTAWKVGPRLYVTNLHVVTIALERQGYGVYIIPSTTGSRPLEARIRASTPHDLALLEIDADTPGAPLPIASLPPDAGDDVVALGYPGQLDQVLQRQDIAEPAAPDVSKGYVMNRTNAPDETGTPLARLVHGANVWPGNSGGPLLDKCMRVVGVNTAVHAEGGLAQQNIAIAAEPILAFLRDNDVSPIIDPRPCSSSVIAGAPSPDPGPDTDHSRPNPRHGPDPLGGFGVLLILIPLALGLCAGIVFLVRREEQRPTPPRRTGGRW